jgi:hypothetical protein
MDTRFLYACRVWILWGIAAALPGLIAPITPAYAGPGDVSTIAGGYIGDNGPATSARINNPAHLAVDAAGNVYIVDTYNQRIRKVAADGTISTVAGNGISAFAGDGGPATAASINEANGVAVDEDGNIFIADSFNQRIRKVNASDGLISTVAGTGGVGYGGYNIPVCPEGEYCPLLATDALLNYPYSVATDSLGRLYIPDANGHRVRVVQTDGTISTIAGSGTPTFDDAGGGDFSTWMASLNYPTDVAVDAVGNIYIADTNNNRIRKVTIANYSISTVAGNGAAAYAGDGGPAADASLDHPYGVEIDAAGNIYIADTYNNRIRMVNTAGNISTIAGSLYGYDGDGGPATNALLRYPMDVVLAGGDLYISDQFNDCIRKITGGVGGNISTIAGSPVNAFYGDSGPATEASLNYAHGVGTDVSGNVYIADTKNNRIRRVSAATGAITAVAGNGTAGYAGDNGAAAAASLNNPYGVTTDSAGNIYISDTYNHRIRKVLYSSGTITTIAGNGNPLWTGDGVATAVGLNGPRGLAFDQDGNLYVADTDNHRIRMIDPLGTISTIAGTGTATFSDGPAASAGLNTPTGVAVDSDGNIYIADSGNNRIRKITSGTITTIAGTGTYGYSGDGGPATAANLATPYGVAVDAAGILYIADFYNSKIRKIESGTISTVAGNGIIDVSPDMTTRVFLGFAGDGEPSGPSGESILLNPYSVAVDPAGNVYFADVNNWRVRKISESTAPTLAGVHIASNNSTNTTRAKTGDTVTLTITAAEPIAAPTVTIAGRAATATGGGAIWSASTVMTGTDTEGMLSFSIAYSDLSGIAGIPVSITTDGSSVTFDRTTPTAMISSTASNPTRTSPIPVIVTFSETVTGFTSGDVTVGNGAIGSFTAVNGTTYTFSITPSAQGAVTVDIAAGVALDTAGNGNIVAAQLSRTFDSVSPTATISSIASNPTRTSPIPVTVVFSEAVTGFTSGDVTIGNGAIGSFAAVNGTTYTFNVTPSAQGAVTVDVAAGVAFDAAANGNTAAAQLSRTYDNGGPTATISTTASNPTRTSPIPVTVTFSEAVTGFASGDVTIGNGAIGSFTAVNGTTYTFNVTPSAQGAVTVDVLAGVALDAAGNGNTVAVQLSRTYDTVAPTATISSTAPDPTNAVIPVTVTFSEAVTGFASGDVTIGNGSIGSFTAVNGTTYTFNVTPTANGTVTVNISAGMAFDAAANGNTAAVQLSRTYDSTAPTATISTTASNPTKTSPIPVTVTFSEAVTGFASGDVTIVNGSISLFTAVSGTTYTFSVTPSAQGAVTVDVAAGIAQDAAGNGNTAAAQLSRTYDSVAPAVTISTTAPDPTNTSPIPVTVTFSEAATGFTSGDVAIGNGSISLFTAVSGTTYTFSVTPSAQGAVTVNVAAGIAQDAAGNGNTAAAQLSRTYDSVAPTVTISTTAPDPTSTSPIPVTVTFSEAATGFTSGDVAIGNGSISLFTAVSGTTYTFSVTPSAQGGVTVDVAAGVAQDAAGNGNAAAARLSRTYDSVAPTVTISSTAPNSTNTSPIPVTVTFSEAVTGFTSGDVAIGNGSISLFTAVSGTNYTFSVTPSGQGAVTVDVAAGVALDPGANGNLAAAQLSRTYDTVAPAMTLSTTAPDPTNALIPVTVIFSEAVTGFLSTDVVVVNGAVGAFNGGGTTYTFSVTPSQNGAVTVDVAAGVSQDAAGNGNTAALQLSRTFDSQNPTVTITSTAPNSTNASPIPVIVTFSKPVTGFAIGDVTVGNGNAGSLSGSGTTYTLSVTPSAQGAVTVNIAADVAQDAAENGNLAAVPLTRTYDTAAPAAVISSGVSSPTNALPIPFTVTFNEAVTGFTSGDVAIGNGAIGLFTAVSGTTYTFSVTPAADGTVTVDVAAAAGQDAAGNGNSAAVQFSRTYDSGQPTVTITSTAPNTTNTSPIPVTVTFSEAVTGFISSDVGVTNGSISGFTVSGPTSYGFNVTPSANGPVTIDVAGSVAQDAAGNVNSAALQASWTYDTAAPAVAIGPPSLSVANNSVAVTYTVTYTGADSVTLANANITLNATGTANGTVTVSGAGTAPRTVTISNITGFDGTLGITIAADTASDLAGNLSAGTGPSATFSVDNASGDLDGGGLVDMTDALKALRIAAGLDTPTASDLAHGDVAPLLNGARQPDGKINIADVIAILRKYVGLPSW